MAGVLYLKELSEAVQILEETQTMLEEQLAASQCRAETVVELENEVLKLQQQIEQLTTVSIVDFL